MVDALTRRDDEGRCRLRKASGRCQTTFDPGISEWGNPFVIRRGPASEYIGCWGTTRRIETS